MNKTLQLLFHQMHVNEMLDGDKEWSTSSSAEDVALSLYMTDEYWMQFPDIHEGIIAGWVVDWKKENKS